jgi:hypothetical protein
VSISFSPSHSLARLIARSRPTLDHSLGKSRHGPLLPPGRPPAHAFLFALCFRINTFDDDSRSAAAASEADRQQAAL